MEATIPTLAICRGIQTLNVAAGGSLIQDIPNCVPHSLEHDSPGERAERVHDTSLVKGSILAEIVGARVIRTNSFHHQSVARLASGFRVNATTSDGVIEGMESDNPGWWALAVQWHPEELTDTPENWDRRIFEAFAAAARSRAAGGRYPPSGIMSLT
jgi:putative glutamine amidotransferase